MDSGIQLLVTFTPKNITPNIKNITLATKITNEVSYPNVLSNIRAIPLTP